jgi:hypothetical protein
MAQWRGYSDTSPNITVSIDGTDYSANLGNGFVESTFIDSDNPLGKFWSGQFTLTNDTARVVSGSLVAAIDLDPTTNADFERGNLVVIVANGNTLRLRVEFVSISAWGADLTPSEIEVSVVDKLGLVNRDFPANPVFRTTRTRDRNRPNTTVTQSLGYSTWLDSIRSELLAPRDSDRNPILVAADLNLVAPTTLANGFPDGFTTPQNRGRNPCENAARIAASRGYTLYCDPTDEVIRLTTYPITSNQATVTRRLALSQMLLVEPSLTPIDEPVESITISVRSTQVALPGDEGGDEEDMVSWPSTIPVAVGYPPTGNTEDPIVVVERIEQEPNISGNTWTQEYSVRARSFHLFERSPFDVTAPNLNTAFVTVCQGEIIRVQNVDGNPITNNDVQSVARGVAMNNGVPESRLPVTSQYYGDTTLVSGQGTRERFEYDSRGVPISRVKETRGTLVSLALTDTPGAVQTDITAVRVLESETETNTYRPDGKYNQIIAYSIAAMAKTGNPDDTGLIPERGRAVTRIIDGVPRPNSARTPVEPLGVEQYDSTQSVISPLGKKRSRHQSIAWGTSSSHATSSARVALALKQQGAISYDIERALLPGESFVPFRCEHVGDRALICDAERLAWAPGNMRFSYTGRQIGTLAAAVTVPRYPRPIPGVTALTAGPMGDLV